MTNFLRDRVFILISLISVACVNSPPHDSGRTNREIPIRKQSVVTFTPNALKKVKEFQAADGGKYLRVDVLPGYLYDIRFEDAFSMTDDILDEQSGVQVIVSKMAQPYLLGSTIDWRTDNSGNEGFHFDNPNALPDPTAPNPKK